MIGDFLIAIKEFLHQHFLCLHDYKWINRKDYGGGSFELCEKCNKIK